MKRLVMVQMVRLLMPLSSAKKFIPRFMHLSHESSFSLTSGARTYKPPPPGFSVVETAVEGAGRRLAVAVEVKPARVNVVNVVAPGIIDGGLCTWREEVVRFPDIDWLS
jgi:hypothetical protein